VVIDHFELPGQWPQVRGDLEATPDTTALYQRLLSVDPAAAAKMEPTNRRRIVRALEVTLGSGRPFSTFGPGVDDYPPSEVVQVGLKWPREVIAARIATRVHLMMEQGLVEEVRSLVSVGLSRTAAQALGYKEIVAAIEGTMSEDEAVDMIITRTRQFAVRQERWFRRDPRVRWIEIEHDAVAEAAPAVISALST
jgi:tRNA dimethylallyltransferase